MPEQSNWTCSKCGGSFPAHGYCPKCWPDKERMEPPQQSNYEKAVEQVNNPPYKVSTGRVEPLTSEGIGLALLAIADELRELREALPLVLPHTSSVYENWPTLKSCTSCGRRFRSKPESRGICDRCCQPH